MFLIVVVVLAEARVLNKGSQHLASSLQQRVSSNNLKETLQSLAALLNDLIREAVGEDLSGEWGDVDSGGLSLQHIPEPLEVRVTATNSRRLQLKGRDIGSADNLIISEHLAGDTVVLGIPDLNLQEVLGLAVDIVESLGLGLKTRVLVEGAVLYRVGRVHDVGGGVNVSE